MNTIMSPPSVLSLLSSQEVKSLRYKVFLTVQTTGSKLSQYVYLEEKQLPEDLVTFTSCAPAWLCSSQSLSSLAEDIPLVLSYVKAVLFFEEISSVWAV